MRVGNQVIRLDAFEILLGHGEGAQEDDMFDAAVFQSLERGEHIVRRAEDQV